MYILALRTIYPGEELFCSYGEAYFERRRKKLGRVPLKKHYDDADDIISEMKEAVFTTNDSLLMKDNGDVNVIIEPLKDETTKQVVDLNEKYFNDTHSLYSANGEILYNCRVVYADKISD